VSEAFDETFSEPPIRKNAVGEDREKHVTGYSCPFCGVETLKLSYTDIWGDRLRIELYCENPNCDVREFIVLALRAEDATRNRSDVEALDLIDERPIEQIRRDERERTGKVSFHRAVHPAYSSPDAVIARRKGGVRVQVRLREDV
jgi:hypothetical protein